MKPAEPCGETRASARAAALSDAMSSRCSRSSIVTWSFARRCVVDAWNTSLRAIVTACVRSGLFSRNTVAVITLVMLAIERWRLRVLFPEHLVGVRVVDDGRGGAQVGHQIAARVHLVARHDGVGHLARRRDGARARRAGLARAIGGRYRRLPRAGAGVQARA